MATGSVSSVTSVSISLSVGKQDKIQLPESNVPSRTPSPHVSMATKEDYDSVRNNYKSTLERDYERILLENHSHVLQKRDYIYSEAKKKGITKRSKIIDRLEPIGKIAKYCFYNIEPPNEYTAVMLTTIRNLLHLFI